MTKNRLTSLDKDYMAACLRSEMKSCVDLLNLIEDSECDVQNVRDALRQAGDNLTRIREGLEAEMIGKRWPRSFFF